MRKLILLSFALTCLGSAFGQNKNINTAIANFDYRQALHLISKEKPTAQLESLKARCYKNLQEYDRAAAVLEKLAAADTSTVELMVELADVYQLSGNLQKAKNIYRKCIAQNTENSYFRLNYIGILYKLKEWDNTITEITGLLKTDTIAALYPVMGDCFWQKDALDSARVYYYKLLEVRPYDYNTTGKLARLHLQKQEYADLIQCTERYLATDSNNIQMNQYNGIGYYFDKQYDKAILPLLKAYKAGETSFSTNYYLGSSYFGKQDYFSAFDHLSEAYAIDSSNVNLIFHLGRSAIGIGQFQKAISLFDRGIQAMTPKDSTLYNFYSNMGLAYQRAFKLTEAIACYEKCMKALPGMKTPIYKIARMYDYDLKNTKMALKYYNMFLALPNNEDQSPFDKTTGEPQGTYYSAIKNRVEELKTEEFFRK